MNLTLKIASALFIAIGFVFVVVGFREWTKPSSAEHARTVISTLTPEKLVSNCGEPLKDEMVDLGASNLRRMYYEGAVYPGHGHYLCVVTFAKVDRGAAWFPQLRPFAFGGSNAGFVPGGYTFEDDPEKELRMLPCVDH